MAALEGKPHFAEDGAQELLEIENTRQNITPASGKEDHDGAMPAVYSNDDSPEKISASTLMAVFVSTALSDNPIIATTMTQYF